eukprot:maker-scaffold1526_size37455-snap-gene-0.11 protein:Tk00731 transcript:maker-scaffold1526_size37455-snap-gene-0.11-mRNA-1 annotation:"60s ribosomal protein l21"
MTAASTLHQTQLQVRQQLEANCAQLRQLKELSNDLEAQSRDATGRRLHREWTEKLRTSKSVHDMQQSKEEEYRAAAVQDQAVCGRRDHLRAAIKTAQEALSGLRSLGGIELNRVFAQRVHLTYLALSDAALEDLINSEMGPSPELEAQLIEFQRKRDCAVQELDQLESGEELDAIMAEIERLQKLKSRADRPTPPFIMTNPKGYRRGTRDMFSRAYKTKGVQHLSTYLKCYKTGDIVDIKGNGAFQKGMPHKSYHGKTGRVFNVAKHAVGVIVNKRVKGRILPKRISVRIEHVTHSKCRTDFLSRVKANEVKKEEAKKAGQSAPDCKRRAEQPIGAHLVSAKDNQPQFLAPIPYEFVA